MFCPKCGNEMNEGAAFCPKCGERINSTESSATTPTERTKGKGKAGKVALIVSAVVLGLFVLLVVIGSHGTGSTSSVAEEDSAPATVSSESDTATTETTEKNKEEKEEESTKTEETSVDNDSVKKLIELIDNAESLITSSDSAFDKELKSEDSDSKYYNLAKILANDRDEIKKLWDEEKKIQGLGDTIQSAGDAYFDLIYNSRKSCYEVTAFLADYLKMYNEVLCERPKPSAGYEDFGAWYQSAKDRSEGIENIPSCIREPWEKYKSVLDYNEKICQKLNYVEEIKKQLNRVDWLRADSTGSLNQRYIKMENNAYEGIHSAYKGEVEFAKKQKQLADDLANEIHSYSELGDSEKASYEFKNDKTNSINLQYETVQDIYPSLYSTYDAFVVLKTGCLGGSRDIVVEMDIPGFTQKYKQSFGLDSSYNAINIKPPALSGNIDLSSSKEAQINLSVYEKDGTTLIDSKTFPVTIKSINDMKLYDDEFGVSTADNLLSFLTPDSKSLVDLKRKAIDEMKNMTDGSLSLEAIDGYQSGSPIIVYYQVAGLMRAMYDMGIRYNMDGFSIDDNTQHILLPEEVMEKKSGLCIETSLLMASALQSAGFNVFLILPPGHAQVAVETGDGSGNYFLIETTFLSEDSNNDEIFIKYAYDFSQALKANDNSINNLPKGYPISYYSPDEWCDYIEDASGKNGGQTYVIDCSDAKVLGISPFIN